MLSEKDRGKIFSFYIAHIGLQLLKHFLAEGIGRKTPT